MARGLAKPVRTRRFISSPEFFSAVARTSLIFGVHPVQGPAVPRCDHRAEEVADDNEASCQLICGHEGKVFPTRTLIRRYLQTKGKGYGERGPMYVCILTEERWPRGQASRR